MRSLSQRGSAGWAFRVKELLFRSQLLGVILEGVSALKGLAGRDSGRVFSTLWGFLLSYHAAFSGRAKLRAVSMPQQVLEVELLEVVQVGGANTTPLVGHAARLVLGRVT